MTATAPITPPPGIHPQQPSRRRLWIGGAIAAMLVLGFAGWWNWGQPASPELPVEAAEESSESANDPAGAIAISEIELPQSAWKSAGLKFEPAAVRPLRETIRVTGSVALNEDRVAHLFPLVDGRVDQVLVGFGETVRTGDVLAIVQSKEVGEKKLELVQARLAREIAEVNAARSAEVDQNTQALIKALKAETPIETIESEFENRPMGNHRERLVTAATALIKSTADFDRLNELTTKGVTSAKDLAAAKAARDADRATYTALLDEVAFESRQAALAASQAARLSEAGVAAAETSLQILGYTTDELAKIDPAKEGEALSHYPVVAPFDGTILTKDAALHESVGPDRKMFEIADLSTVWIVADIFEHHLASLGDLDGQSVRVRSAARPAEVVDAQVFFTGATIDPQTRTARLRALADNKDGHLRPGMFVEVELVEPAVDDVLQVPMASRQEHAGNEFVFVHIEGDQFVRRDVTTGRRSGDYVEIVDGLSVGENVVTEGGFALKSQMLADLMAGD